jgi:hypothetical protein
MKHRYLVVAPPYNPDSGGSIFLHELVHALNSLGASAALWPINRRTREDWSGRAQDVLRRPSILWRPRPVVTAPGLLTPIATRSDLTRHSIVVYPEIVLGNPLRARNVVRWLLYRPGLRDPFRFGPGEMFFRAGEMSDLPDLTGTAHDLFLWKINPAYKDEGRPDRKGACFLVRKGADKPRIAQTEGAIQIDGKSHEEIAAIFNRCEVFYSYDEASFYSQYAALCGCRSVVVPGLYPAREAWVKEHPVAAFGVAYGLEDLGHADATRHRVIELLRAKEAAGLDTVRHFITLTEARFGRT